MFSRLVPRVYGGPEGGGGVDERGTPVAGALCFVLGGSIFVLYSTLLSRCLSSRHKLQMNLWEIGLYIHENAHFGQLLCGSWFPCLKPPEARPPDPGRPKRVDPEWANPIKSRPRTGLN